MERLRKKKGRYRCAGCLDKIVIWLFALSCIAMACSDDIQSSGGNGETTDAVIRLTVNAATPQEVSTRSVDEDKIHDLHVLVYNSLGELTGQSYSIFDSSASAYTVTVNARSGNDCKIYAVANTNSSTFFDGAVANTEEKLKAMTTSSTAWTDLNNISAITAYLPMCGSTTANINAGTTTLNGGMTVKRLVAKVSLNIGIVSGSGITITDYSICSMPAKAYYINRPLTTEDSETDNAGETGDEPCRTATSSDWINSGTIDAGGATSVSTSFYIYNNRRGVNSAITEQNKKIKVNAPDSATYVLINGQAAGYKATWRVYLGANNTTNFNLKRNRQYTYDITLSRNDADARVSVDYITAPESNCYMLAPGEMVNIPVSRANKSPLVISGATLVDGTYHQLLSDTHWTASLLWETVSGLVSISNASGTGPSSNFRVIANSVLGVTSGNAVVQIKNDADSVLWSWHIWVTNYDPNNQINGVVHTLNNGQRDYVFMDRNLGATRTDYDSTDAGMCGLYYQWGRKDPFPGSGGWNNEKPILSGEVSSFTLTTVRGITPSVRFPANFITDPDNSHPDWSLTGNEYLWNSESGTKTVYDPCPSGWRVPKFSGVDAATSYPWYYLENAAITATTYTSTTNAIYGGTKILDGDTFRGWNFFKTVDGVTTSLGSYPACGYLYVKGNFVAVGAFGNSYVADSYGANSIYVLHFVENHVFLSSDFPGGSSFGKAHGCTIRCVKE